MKTFFTGFILRGVLSMPKPRRFGLKSIVQGKCNGGWGGWRLLNHFVEPMSKPRRFTPGNP